MLCVLSLLHDREMYGYELVQSMEQLSHGKFVLPEGTLYPILYRLEERGFVSTKKVLVGRRMTRVYYRLSESGSAHYVQMLQEYETVRSGVQKILEHRGGSE